MHYYVALIHKDADTDFGVSFPDFPGCISAGSTLSEAVAMDAEALTGHIDLMSDEGLQTLTGRPGEIKRTLRQSSGGGPRAHEHAVLTPS